MATIYGKLKSYRHYLVTTRQVDNADLYPFVRDTNSRAYLWLISARYRPTINILRRRSRSRFRTRFKSRGFGYPRHVSPESNKVMMAFDRQGKFPTEVTPRSYRH